MDRGECTRSPSPGSPARSLVASTPILRGLSGPCAEDSSQGPSPRAREKSQGGGSMVTPLPLAIRLAYPRRLKGQP